MIICNNHLSNQWMRGSFPFVTFIFLSSMFHSFNYVHLSSPLMNLFHFILLYIIMLLLMGFWSLSIVHCLYVEVICMVFYLNFRYFNCTGLSKNNTTKDKCRNMVKRKTHSEQCLDNRERGSGEKGRGSFTCGAFCSLDFSRT